MSGQVEPTVIGVHIDAGSGLRPIGIGGIGSVVFPRLQDFWAPEELLVGSVNTCMMLTFLSLAQARGLTPAGYESEVEGLLENIDGKYSFTEMTVRPIITVKSEAELEPTREIMERAEAHCFISNSVKAKIKVVAELVVAPSPK